MTKNFPSQRGVHAIRTQGGRGSAIGPRYLGLVPSPRRVPDCWFCSPAGGLAEVVWWGGGFFGRVWCRADPALPSRLRLRINGRSRWRISAEGLRGSVIGSHPSASHGSRADWWSGRLRWFDTRRGRPPMRCECVPWLRRAFPRLASRSSMTRRPFPNSCWLIVFQFSWCR
jgi:hypothetical protein